MNRHSKEGSANPHHLDGANTPSPVSSNNPSTIAAGRKSRHSGVQTSGFREDGGGRARVGKHGGPSETSSDNGGGRDGGRSVLLRRVAFVSNNSDEEGEDGVSSNSQRADSDSKGLHQEDSGPAVDAARRRHTRARVDRVGPWRDEGHPHRDETANNRIVRSGNGPSTSSELHRSGSQRRRCGQAPESGSHDDGGACTGESLRASDDGPAISKAR